MVTLLKAHTATIKLLGALVFLVAGFATARAEETPFLERPVTISANNQSISEVFKTISAQTGVVFSYNPRQFDDKQRISLTINNKPLRVVLDELMRTTLCSYTLKKKYIIIKCPQQKPSPKRNTYIISGYLVNSYDGGIITNASVFIKSARESAITDSLGFFSLVAPKTETPLLLSIAKENYKDTTMVITGTEDKEVYIYLSPVKKPAPVAATPKPSQTISDTAIVATADTIPVVAVADSTPALPTNRFWEKQKKLNANFRNIRDTLFSKVSFSLVPAISTNKLLSFNTINNLSFNVLIGKSKGVNGVEIAGWINYDYGNVQYVQVAGWANVVAGDAKYVQAAGLFNSVLGNVNGVQAGGIYNYSKHHMNGVQAGGIFNHANTVYGVQTGGVFNTVNDSLYGVQAGGIFNFVRHSVNGVQVGGIFNHAQKVNGAQIAGIYNLAVDTIYGGQIGGVVNIAGYAAGTQIAGAVNIADTIAGTQIAGILNFARMLKGVQIAPVNIADSCLGLPIGVFSYVRNGYHKIEVLADELQLISVGFRSGVNKLHNVFFAGYNNFHTEKLWTYGYGLGSYLKLTPKKGLLFDVSAQQLQNTRTSQIKLNLLQRGAVSYTYNFGKKFNISAGPTINLLVQDKTDVTFSKAFDAIAPATFVNVTEGNTQFRAWVGAKVSLKFL